MFEGDMVRECPKCGHKNPEEEQICSGPNCGEFLGFVDPTPITKVKRKPHQDLETGTAHSFPTNQPLSPHPSNVEGKEQSHPVTTRYESQAMLYLKCSASGKAHMVHPGWIMGQSHPTSQANIQISGVPGVNFIHRHHCRFDHDNGRWFVTAIDQQSFTNPTIVNDQKLAPGQNCVIKHGDKLTLVNTTFTVDMIES